MYNNIEVVKALLRYGAKVKQRDLTHAITYAKIEMLETLLIYVPDIDQFHTLYYAAYYDRIDVVKMLVKYGADVNRNVGEYRPPLITATRTANVRTMSELLKNGANANLKDFMGNAPIHLALFLKQESMELLYLIIDIQHLLHIIRVALLFQNALLKMRNVTENLVCHL